jgi:hypothetical protein
MRPRAVMLTTVAFATLALAAWGAAPAGAATTCTWGGTPDAPTGTFTLKPGLTSTPASEPLVFRATGLLAGAPGCTGRLTFTGRFHVGSTCAFAHWHGRVEGLPGVAAFAGGAVGPIGPSLLYDKHGNVVGSEQARVHPLPGDSQLEDCFTPEGFTHAHFTSTVELF